MIALSCGIKISAVHHLVVLQSTRVTDRQTGGRTDRITTPKTALAYARVVKIGKSDRLTACLLGRRFGGTLAAGESIIFQGCRVVHVLCSIHVIASPVGGDGGMQVGKGKDFGL